MSDIKIAILRTFETTVKALLINDSVTPVFDSDSNIGFGQICDHLQSIRHELSEVKNRLQHIEQRQNQNVVVENGESIWFDNKCRNVEQTEISENDELEHDLSMVLAAPIPLKTVSEERPDTPPVPPEILPNLVTTEETVPDIEEDDEHHPQVSTPTATTANSDSEEPASNTQVVNTEVADAEGEEADDTDDADVDEAGDADEAGTGEADADETGDDDEAGDADADEADEEEEGLEEFTFKGKTYYKDGDNLVYILNSDGELNEDPVGRWNEAMSVVRFFAKTVA